MLILLLLLLASGLAGPIQLASMDAESIAAWRTAWTGQAQEAQLDAEIAEAEADVLRCLANLAPEDAAQAPNVVVITARQVESEAEEEALTPIPAVC